MPDPTDADQFLLGRRIADVISELVQRYGAEHPLLDILIEQRLEELLQARRFP